MVDKIKRQLIGMKVGTGLTIGLCIVDRVSATNWMVGKYIDGRLACSLSDAIHLIAVSSLLSVGREFPSYDAGR